MIRDIKVSNDGILKELNNIYSEYLNLKNRKDISKAEDIFISLKNILSENYLSISVDKIILTTWARNCLLRANIKTLGDILELGAYRILFCRGVGWKLFDDIIRSILKVLTDSQIIPRNFREDLNNAFSYISPGHLKILKDRYGYSDGRIKSYSEAGNSFKVTREHAWYVVNQAVKTLRNMGRLKESVEELKRISSKNHEALTFNKIQEDEFFLDVTEAHIKFFINMLRDIYPEEVSLLKTYDLIDSQWR